MLLKLRHSEAPLSVNRAWRKFRGHMVRSPEFKNWEASAVANFQQSAAGARLPEWCYWAVDIYIPRRQYRSDIDNGAKAVIDAIVRAGLTPDDRYVVDSRLRFWGGNYLLVYVKDERLDTWLDVMNPSPAILRKMRKSQTLSLPV
jgi:Holliday junction resolvase RusA-like endonuclease